MPIPTKAVLDLQSDQKRATVPALAYDVANKSYVDAAIVTATPPATSGIGGGTVGLATADEGFGLYIPSGGNMQVKVDGMTVGFTPGGALQAVISTATSAPGGGVRGIVTADSSLGLSITAGIMGFKPDTTKGLKNTATGAQVKVDGTSIQFDGLGQLTSATGVVFATSSGGGGQVGIATYDENAGLHIATILGNPVAQVKVDGASVFFNGLGQLASPSGSSNGIGLVSARATFARNIIGGPSAPNQVTLGTNVSCSSYPNAALTGERFTFTIPDDYYAGDLDILLVYSMSAAVGSPNNQIRITTAVENAKVSGSIDAATYPQTAQTLTTPVTTNVVRATVLTMTQGTFDAGDQVTVLIQRLGSDVLDLSTAAWQVIGYEWRYSSVISARVATDVVDYTLNAVGETPGINVTVGTQTDAVQFPSATDAGLKFSVIVPDNWDGVSPALLCVNYSMSTGAGGNVQLNTYGEVADVVTGAINAIPSTNFTVAVPANTNPVRLVGFAQIPMALLHKGDICTLVVARRTAVGGNSTAAFNFIGATVQFLISPTVVTGSSRATERYMDAPSFGNASGTVYANDVYPVFGGTTFDQLFSLSSTSAAGRVDAAFSGRLATFQTLITQVRINMIGTGASPHYHLQVYAEGTALPVYDSGLQPAPVTMTELVVTNVQLSAQPTGSKRFQIVVQAFIDASETILVSTPFVRQE